MSENSSVLAKGQNHVSCRQNCPNIFRTTVPNQACPPWRLQIQQEREYGGITTHAFLYVNCVLWHMCRRKMPWKSWVWEPESYKQMPRTPKWFENLVCCLKCLAGTFNRIFPGQMKVKTKEFFEHVSAGVSMLDLVCSLLTESEAAVQSERGNESYSVLVPLCLVPPLASYWGDIDTSQSGWSLAGNRRQSKGPVDPSKRSICSQDTTTSKIYSNIVN